MAMKIVVLGGGVIGVTTAYYLARNGHEVTVLERQPGPALETSFANAGEISPGYASPWAAPGVPAKAMKWLLMKHSPLVVRPKLDPRMWGWLFSMLRNCTSARYALNKGRMVRLAEYSRDQLIDLRAQTGIAYDERALGTLQLFRTQKQVDASAGDIAVLKQYGVPFEVLDVAGCIAAEPGLAQVKEKFVGGLRLPGDETGDCHLFTQRLADICAAMGVTFRYGVSIKRIDSDGRRVTGIVTDTGVVTGDGYVLALGSYSPFLVKEHGMDLPVYPVKGYSITVPIEGANSAPISTVMDETYKIAITRLGDRIRVGGTAEIAGFDLTLRPARKETLLHSVRDLFPSAGAYDKASFWCGLRPMTPDGTPAIGPSTLGNLWLNTGHGTLGWTMACGSGRVVADLISGKAPEIDMAGLTIARYGAALAA